MKLSKSTRNEYLLWALVILLVFCTGYYRGLKRMQSPFQISQEPVRILTYDSSLFTLDLLDYLEFELQRPVEVTSVSNWEEFQSKLVSSNQIALMVFPATWAERARSQDLIYQRSGNEIEALNSRIHTEFRNSTQSGIYYPWLWAQIFRLRRITQDEKNMSFLSESTDINCSFYQKPERSKLHFRTENLALTTNETNANSRIVTHRTEYNPNSWIADQESVLFEIVLFEPKTTEIKSEVRLRLLTTLMTESTYDFIRSNKPFATSLFYTRSTDSKQTGDFISQIELKRLKKLEICEKFN